MEKMKRFIQIILFLLTPSLFATPIHVRDSDAPFIIFRMMNTSSEDYDYMKFITDILKKYPKTFDEVWLATHAYFPSLKTIELDAKDHLTKVSKLWSDVGIRPSYQIGTTLGHGNNNNNDHGFTKEAYKLNHKGERTNSLCANSPEVQKYFYDRTKVLIENSPLESIWLDDDFRMGLRSEQLCFCKFCMEKFNTKTKADWTVKDLYAKLSSMSINDASLRKSYIDFQMESLNELAKIVAKARDDSSRQTILGIQSVHSLEAFCHDYPSMLTAFANGKKAGIRIGSGCYNEYYLEPLIYKLFGVMYETERCARNDNVYQICYEAENYPHIETLKTPRAMMIECALVLASGCDSLSLYWDNVTYYQAPKVHEKFYRTVKEYRPFLEKLGEFYKGTTQWGIGRFIGDTMFTRPNKHNGEFVLASYPSNQEQNLFLSGFPARCTDSYADIIMLTDSTISKIDDAQIKKLLSKHCIADINTLKALENRGFKLPVKVKEINDAEIFGGAYSEVHRDKRFDMIPWHNFTYLEIVDKSVKNVSKIIKLPNEKIGSAFAVFDTEFGGKIFAVSGNGIHRFSTEHRRLAFLDAIDELSPAPFRLETNHQMIFIPRVDKNGKLANALFYNYTKGDCDELILRIRSNAPEKYKLIRPLHEDLIIESKKAENGDGYILTLPELLPVSVYAIQKID